MAARDFPCPHCRRVYTLSEWMGLTDLGAVERGRDGYGVHHVIADIGEGRRRRCTQCGGDFVCIPNLGTAPESDVVAA